MRNIENEKFTKPENLSNTKKTSFKPVLVALLSGTVGICTPTFAIDNIQTSSIITNSINDFALDDWISSIENVSFRQVAEDGQDTIGITFPDNSKHFYQYTYTLPENYEVVEQKRFTDSFNPLTSNNKTYKNTSSNGDGGVISNSYYKPDMDIIADFINNKTTDSKSVSGGAIYNYGTLGNINGNFIHNQTTTLQASAPAIRNNGTINNIQGNFIDNSSISSIGGGGTVYNNNRITTLKGNFIGNTHISNSSSSYAYGGGFYNQGTINFVEGNFIANKVQAEQASAYGGAIWNAGNLGKIDNSNFLYNITFAGKQSIGGAIRHNGNLIKELTNSSFIGNGAVSTNSNAYGGGLDIERGTIEYLSADFIGNYAVSNSRNSYGGAIYNDKGTIGKIENSTFSGNYVSSESGQASGGAIYNTGTIGDISGSFKNNTATTNGGAIYNEGAIGEIKNSNFQGNWAKTESDVAQGGAIYSTKDLNIIADGAASVFKDNYTQAGEVKDDNAIYLDNGAAVNFEVKNNGHIDMYDNIRGASLETTETAEDGTETTSVKNYSVNITGDSTGTFNMYNDMYEADLSAGKVNLNTINNIAHTYAVNNFTLTGDVNMTADVDLANKKMDRISAKTYGEHTGSLNVTGMNLLSDSAAKKTEIYFAEQGLKDHVTNGTAELPQSDFQTTAYTPIYKYEVSYDNREDGGYFVFNRGGNGGGNSSSAFNPAVLASPIAAQSGATSVVNQTFNYAFQNADNFMNIPYLERLSVKNANKYAITANGNATDVGNFSPLFTKSTTDSVWVKPYASFENVPLKNGPKVSNITYGTLFGYDTELIPMKHGWDRVWTGYIGYNGASQRYSGVDSTQNGGLLGGTLTLYKGNFFNATTVSAGASVGSNQTMYGHEDMTMLLAGVANKTGYNFEFKEGKLILQPSLMTSYTFVNTFDYTNAAGVRIKSDPLHSIQLSPNLKIIGNTKNGWQPYASVGMVWNILDETKVTAGETKLPEMSIKPYVQYGVGVQKRFKDKCMAFGQAMIQNGGRNGVSLTAGFRWSLGKEGKPIEKVTLPQKQAVSPNSAVTGTVASGVKPERKVLKQLTPAQRTALGAKPQNTTRTTTAAVLKQM